jgi:hypothetical protein
MFGADAHFCSGGHIKKAPNLSGTGLGSVLEETLENPCGHEWLEVAQTALYEFVIVDHDVVPSR